MEPTLNSATVNYSDNGGTLMDNDSCDDIAIMLENAAFSWSHSLVENYVSIISQLSLAIPTGSLVVILGKVCIFAPFSSFCNVFQEKKQKTMKVYTSSSIFSTGYPSSKSFLYIIV